MGGNGVLQEFNVETHASRLPVVMLRDEGSFSWIPKCSATDLSRVSLAISSAGGKPVLFLWQWCTPETSAEMMTQGSVCDALEFTDCNVAGSVQETEEQPGLYWVECMRKSVEWLRAVLFQLGKHQTRKEHVCCPSLLWFCRMSEVRKAWAFPQ